MKTVSSRGGWLLAPVTAGAVWLAAGACGTPPKPDALVAYQDLKAGPQVEQARKRYPDLVASSDQYGAKAEEEWQSNDLDDSTRAALMAQIKLKTALARYEQENAKARMHTLTGEQARADETLDDVTRDLNAETKQVTLMQKLAESKRAAEAEKQKLAEQMSSGLKEKQQLELRLATEQKRSEAQLAIRTADTVEASKYAAPDYGAATSMLAKADVEMKQGSWEAAQASLEVAKKSAERATAAAKPAYEEAGRATEDKARNDALARDASALPGVSVRIDRRGQLQQLVIAVPDLFAKMQTSVSPGKDGVLDPISKLIAKYPTYPVQVVGHTDNKGKTGELIAISQARAQAVFSSLVARGIEARRMIVSGQGPNEPLTDNKSPAGRAKNSRIEIIFMYH
jgi:outer membrane protein OmpA-like peptidoglycan-associated protein